MASLSCQANGTKVIQFLDTEGRRRTLRLGKTSKRNAEKFKLKLESLIFARSQGHPPDEETATWLTKLNRQMLERLASVNLITPPGETLLTPFIESYIAKHYLQVTEDHFARALKSGALHEKQEAPNSTHEERMEGEPRTQKKRH